MMHAIFAAIARVMKGMLGLVWMPIEFAAGLFSGGGGGGGSTQDRAALVAKQAAADEAARDLQLTADKPLTLDEAATIKRVARCLLLSKPISPETRISPALLDMLINAPTDVLRNLADSDAYAVTEFVNGYRESCLKGNAARTGVPEVTVDAQFPKLASRIADYRARSPKPHRDPSDARGTPRRRTA